MPRMIDPVKPSWLERAERDTGLREIPGMATEPRIRRWLIEARAWWNDDETPWCGVAMRAWMTACGIAAPARYYKALSWADWGDPLERPAYGCIAVWRRRGGGHVNLLVGIDQSDRYLGLGGNQRDSVCVLPFDQDRLEVLRWPPGQWLAERRSPLPYRLYTGSSSNQEV